MFRVGVIGLGIMGTHTLRDFVKDARFTVTRIWDLNRDRANEVKQELNSLEIADSAENLISDESVDIIYIATPPASHIEYCHLALDQHKPILCEKPLSTDQQAAELLVRRIQASDTPAALNFMYEEMDLVHVLYKALDSGEIGDVTAITVNMNFPAWPRPWQKTGDWLWQRKEGGFVREVFTHYAFLIDVLCGPLTLKAKHVTYVNELTASETGVIAYLEANQVPVQLSGVVGYNAPENIQLTIYGSQKSFRILNWSQLETSVGSQWVPVSVMKNSPLSDLAKMLKGEPHLLGDFAAGLRTQQVVESIVG